MAIDLLSDAFRWWASPGALMAFFLIIGWLRPESKIEPKVLPKHSRIMAGGAMLFAMFSIMIAGAIIPLATDGRVSWLDADTLLYRTVMMFAWLGWGLSAWCCALALTDWRKMLAGCLSWLAACGVAAHYTMGAMM